MSCVTWHGGTTANISVNSYKISLWLFLIFLLEPDEHIQYYGFCVKTVQRYLIIKCYLCILFGKVSYEITLEMQPEAANASCTTGASKRRKEHTVSEEEIWSSHYNMNSLFPFLHSELSKLFKNQEQCINYLKS